MSKVYFLGSILPPLRVGDEPPLLFDELMMLYRDNLSRSELEKIEKIRLYIDLKNIQKLLKNQPIDSRGTLSEKELDEAIVNQEGLPDYLFDFFEEFQEVSDQLRNYSKVLITYFKEMKKKCRGFLKDYFCFEREWRILLAGYRAKKLGVDLMKELQYEDFHDPFVAEVIAQKDAPFFEFPFEYMQLGEKLKEAKSPEEEYYLMAEFRFQWVKEKVQDDPFSISYLLGYLVQLMIVEDDFAQSKEKGSEHLTQMMKGSL
jgi:hypothetical protein